MADEVPQPSPTLQPPSAAAAQPPPPGYPAVPGVAPLQVMGPATVAGFPPSAYGYYPYGTPYPGAPQAAFPPPPANRAWPAHIAVGRVQVAIPLAVAAFSTAAVLRLLEATTGSSDIPGSHAFASATTNLLLFLLRGAELSLVAFAAIVGASSLFPIRESAKFLGQPDATSLRTGAALLGGAATLTVMSTVLASMYFSSSQQSLPGMGVVSDPGLNRLYGDFRVALTASAVAGTAASFAFVVGLERVWRGLMGARGRRDYGRFARLFTLAAALNTALVFVLFFGVIQPPTLDHPPSQSWSLGLLAIGPALAAASFVFLRRAVRAAEENARALANRAPAPKA